MNVGNIVLQSHLEWTERLHVNIIEQISKFDPGLKYVEEERSRIFHMKQSGDQNLVACALNDERTIEQYHWKLCSERFELLQKKDDLEYDIDFLKHVLFIN